LLEENNPYPPLYVQFFYHFNIDRDYFECHEVLEELWLDRGREKFYQGLLQVAVGLHHARNENINGARKILIGALEKLDLYPEKFLMGINLEKVKSQTKAFLQKVLTGDVKPFTPFEIDIIDPLLQQCVEEIRAKA
jgi:predicted metal-dependent hydrolase